jgi:hypothetical protein
LENKPQHIKNSLQSNYVFRFVRFYLFTVPLFFKELSFQKIVMSKKALGISDFTKLCREAKFNSPVVNAIASCIDWHQKRHIGLHSISLKPALYDRFVHAMWKLNGAPFEEGTPFELCHVLITKGSLFQVRDMMPEMWKDYQKNEGEKFPETANQ